MSPPVILYEEYCRRALTRKIEIIAVQVRQRLISGPLTAYEMLNGVSLTHQEFVLLADMLKDLNAPH